MSREINDSFERPLLKALWCIALSFAICAAASDAADRPGASTLASVPVVDLPQAPIYWHLDTYGTRAEADAAKGPRARLRRHSPRYGCLRLRKLTGGRPEAPASRRIGPLRVHPEGRYTASYMQAATSPGFQTDIHQPGGQEALFTLSGEVCVETPDGKLVGRAGGEPLLINRDVPMQLTSVGSELRRSLVLILHDAAQPWKVPTPSPWVPKGLCMKPKG